VVVSSGKQQVQIPSLVGSDPASAGQQLGALGLNVKQAQEASSTIPSGEVTRTDPPASSSVPVGSTVTVYTSTGPPLVKVPNVKNMTQPQANAALSSAGFQAQFSTVPVSNQNQDGVAVSQSPSAGTSEPQGSTVQVSIGSYSAPSTTTTTTGSPPNS
jgi:serine/threonine-protein kinase